MENNEEFDFALMAKKLKQLKECGVAFEDYLKEEYQFGVKMNILFSFPNDMIYHHIERVDLETFKKRNISRITQSLSRLGENYIIKYRNLINEKYDVKEIPEPPKADQENQLKLSPKERKQLVKEFNFKVKEYRKEVEEIEEWNLMITVLQEYFRDNIKEDLYGDTTLDVSSLPYVYFRMYNTDLNDIEVFIQNLRKCSAEGVNDILRINIEDVMGMIPDNILIQDAKEVQVYFENPDKAITFGKISGEIVESVYQQFVLRIEYMRKYGADWGLWNEKKESLGAGNVGSIQNQNINPLQFSGGGEQEEYFDWFSDELEYSLRECYFKPDKENNCFYIVPKEFYDDYKSLLDNKHLGLFELSNDWSNTGSSIFYYSGDFNEGLEILEEYSEFKDDLLEVSKNILLNKDQDNYEISRMTDDEFDEFIEEEGYKNESDFINACESYQLGEKTNILCFEPSYYDWNLLQLNEKATIYCLGFGRGLTSDHWLIIITESGEKFMIDNEPVEFNDDDDMGYHDGDEERYLTIKENFESLEIDHMFIHV
jgi:hypothetical protein